jgi:hypothetical protein
VLAKLGEFGPASALAATSLGKRLGDALVDAVRKALGDVEGAFTDTSQSILELGTEAAQGFGITLGDPATGLAATLESTLDATLSTGDDNKKFFEALGTSLGGAIATHFAAGIDDVSKDLVGELEDSIGLARPFVAGFRGLGTLLAGEFVLGFQQELQLFVRLQPLALGLGFQLGSQLGEGLIEGMQSQIQAIGAVGAALAKAAEDGARTQAGAHSPSAAFAEVGKDLDRGLATGILALAGDVVGAMAEVVSAAGKAASPAGASAAGNAAGASSAAAPQVPAFASLVGSTSTVNNVFGAPAPAQAPDSTVITVDARGTGGDFWAGREIGKGAADAWHSHGLRFPKR